MNKRMRSKYLRFSLALGTALTVVGALTYRRGRRSANYATRAARRQLPAISETPSRRVKTPTG